ncbi:unnamed protein product [Ilex paraguariensis]|uniref:Uncharacterized protein n=1 Tax=Ilex paraguariensis TaxID=185542 RepID=A0ABC8SYQ1_9AQUA
MNNTSSKDKGKAIITPLGDVGGAMEVPQPGKSLPQVGNMDASSSSAIKSVNNQCPNGPQDETQVTTNILTTIIVSDKNHTEQSAKPIQSPNKFGSLNLEGGEIVVDLSTVPCTNSGDTAINMRQVNEVVSIGHEPEVENLPEGEHKKKKGTQQYQVCCKLKKIKDSFKAKSRELGDISERAKEAKEAVENCQRRKEIKTLPSSLKQGGQNIALFFKTMTSRRNKKKIINLKAANDNGGDVAIKEEATKFFSQLLCGNMDTSNSETRRNLLESLPMVGINEAAQMKQDSLESASSRMALFSEFWILVSV